MPNDISYYQLISLRRRSVKCQVLRGAYVSEGKLVIVFGNNKKVDIDGKNIEVTGQNKRIQEIVVLAVGKGFDIPEKSIKHYAKDIGIKHLWLVDGGSLAASFIEKNILTHISIYQMPIILGGGIKFFGK